MTLLNGLFIRIYAFGVCICSVGRVIVFFFHFVNNSIFIKMLLYLELCFAFRITRFHYAITENIITIRCKDLIHRLNANTITVSFLIDN